MPSKKRDIRMNMAYDLCNENAKILTEISFNFNRFAFCAIYIWSVNYRPNVIISMIGDDNDRNKYERNPLFSIPRAIHNDTDINQLFTIFFSFVHLFSLLFN